MSAENPVVGDKFVKYTEVEVTKVDTTKGEVELRDQDNNKVVVPLETLRTTAYAWVKPPVVTFGPGDVVRAKTGDIYTIGKGGYLHHQSGAWITPTVSFSFTSESFELLLDQP